MPVDLGEPLFHPDGSQARTARTRTKRVLVVRQLIVPNIGKLFRMEDDMRYNDYVVMPLPNPESNDLESIRIVAAPMSSFRRLGFTETPLRITVSSWIFRLYSPEERR